MKTERIIWGVAVIAIGIIWLLQNLGLLHPLTVRELWRYWPVLLILWGALMLVGKGQGAPGCLIAILVLFLFFSGFFTYIFPSVKGPAGTVVQSGISNIYNANAIKLDLVQHAGELNLFSHTSASQLLTLRIQATAQPKVSHTQSGETAEITVQDQSEPINIDKRVSRWDLSLPEKMPIALSLRTGATRARLDMSNLIVSNLDVRAGAGELTLTLGQASSQVTVQGGAGSIVIYVPDRVGVRLRVNGAIVTVNTEDATLVGMGERYYESKNLQDKDVVTDIQVTAGAGSVTLRSSR